MNVTQADQWLMGIANLGVDSHDREAAQVLLARHTGLAAEVSRRGAAIERVRQLHSPDERGNCPGCHFGSDEEPWPWTDCPTIAALDGPAGTAQA